jgi:fumarylacetoacetase
MSLNLDRTHDPSLRSWVESANRAEGPFPIQNLPFGVFRRHEEPARIGVAIGDRIVDLAAMAEAGLLQGLDSATVKACQAPVLNDLMGLGPRAWSGLRQRLSELLRAGSPAADRISGGLVATDAVKMLCPAAVGDFSDFYASVYHATNVGRMFRPENPLLPNYKYVPIGYHGRASSVVVSGTPVHRPRGQRQEGQAEAPVFGPSRQLDYEAEVGFFIGPGNRLGEPVPVGKAAALIFGCCLVNDWSARDIQAWEYQPLGPFLSKSFATTVSPWVVMADALAPFRVPAFARPEGDPAPLPYLDDPTDRQTGGLDLTVEVFLETERMRTVGVAPVRLSRATLRDLYWTPAQLVAHHASNGCPLRPGDLLATGTVSGPDEDSLGCLLERTRRGATPIEVHGGETRRFLEDGDEVIIRGRCVRPGWVSIGLGECRGRIIG